MRACLDAQELLLKQAAAGERRSSSVGHGAAERCNAANAPLRNENDDFVDAEGYGSHNYT